MKIGWIGTGVMGASMCNRLLEAGFSCTVYNRTPERAQLLLDHGANWANSPREVARHSDVVFIIVGFPSDVEEVIFHPTDGVLSGFQLRKQENPSAESGILVDMTTSRPSLAKKIFETAKNQNVSALDAPVSGGDVGAKNGTLSIMIGGESEIVKKLEPVWKILGKSYYHQGAAGAGQHTKMVNQILIAGNMLGVCEALRYAAATGLEAETVLKSVSSGAAGSWSLEHLAPRILKGDFNPGFQIGHFVKDLGIALEEAHAHQLELPGLALAKTLYENLQKLGYGEKGTQALAIPISN
ncbi:MAG: NAD(P)-dependent oxidoreductase [Planctomycetia bacterium]|nr:NAD(P)-dependent oxidoreductase [Planctomycetia bacterium]